MKLNNSLLNALVQSPIGGKETAADRLTRMRQMFSRPENQVIYKVGKYLATKYAGLTLATWLVRMADSDDMDYDPKGLELETVRVAGLDLPVTHSIALNKLSVWACPACGSAHGTAQGASKKGADDRPNPKTLATNEMYYRPVDGTLFTISNTCYERWVRGYGFHTRILTDPSEIRRHWQAFNHKPVVKSVAVDEADYSDGDYDETEAVSETVQLYSAEDGWTALPGDWTAEQISDLKEQAERLEATGLEPEDAMAKAVAMLMSPDTDLESDGDYDEAIDLA